MKPHPTPDPPCSPPLTIYDEQNTGLTKNGTIRMTSQPTPWIGLEWGEMVQKGEKWGEMGGSGGERKGCGGMWLRKMGQ